MPRLFAAAVGRRPFAAPATRLDRNSIYTHGAPPSGAVHALLPAADAAAEPCVPEPERSAAPKDLHDRLFDAWRAKDWIRLASEARTHVQHSGSPPQLHPVSAAAVSFFRPSEVNLQPGDVERFLGRFARDQLAAYLERDHERERRRLADDALALHCLGALGEAPFDYAGALRALHALATAGRLRQAGKAEQLLSPALFDRIDRIDIALPPWVFELDLCRRVDHVWRTSPIEQKIEQVAAHEGGPLGDSRCECAPEADVCAPQDPCCGEVRYFIGDLLELRDWIHGYKAGEIAYIANVAAGETLSREHEMKRTRELFVEMETTERTSEKRDLQVTSRYSLQREIERQKDNSISAEASTYGSYNAEIYKFGGTASGSYTRTSSEAIREAQEEAVETVRSAVYEIEKQTRTARSERSVTEETEKNAHSFTNSGTTPLVTKYFWVTEQRCAQLYSYGKQLLAEFIIPEPARLYERFAHDRREAAIADRIKPPRGKPPVAPELNFKATDLTGENYKQLCDQWGVKDPRPWPPPSMQISAGFADDGRKNGGPIDLGSVSFDIPGGYEAFQATMTGSASYRPDNFNQGFPQKVEFNGAASLYLSNDIADKTQAAFSPHATGHQDFPVSAWNTDSIGAVITLHLTRQAGVLEAWQASVYALIVAEYEKQMAAYEEKMKPWDAYEAAKDKLRQELIAAERSRHPFFKRELQRAEIKRAVIYLMCQDFSVEGAMIRRAEPCGFPEIDRGRTARKGYDWYFWDRLIDWKRMTYAFFDYFWNPMCDWPQRFDPDEPDALFKAFLRAGYARVLVPVSPAMHVDFLWYVSTHQKWGQLGLPPLNPLDSRWRNVVYELEHAKESAMTRREGHIDAANGDSFLVVKGSDRYWDPVAGAVDGAAVALDIDRELFVECDSYLITGIAPEPGSPAFDPLHPDTMWWRLTLDRPFTGATGTGRLYAMGAKAVAPVFSFDLPTELIWTGAHDVCLPTYPLPPC